MRSMKRTFEALPSLPSKLTKSLPVDAHTANVTETTTTNLMRTPRPVHGAVYSHVLPEQCPASPSVLSISKPACDEIDLEYPQNESDRHEFAQVFSGNKILPGTRPWSLCYGGHQFGFWAGQLGDGRAISLFETLNAKNKSWEIQLKGAGRTPYSRFGDGYAVLRSSIREYLMSEHMHALGVPTTRALGLITTEREVYREDGPRDRQPEDGAVVARIAPSWLRFGNFEIFYSRDDMDNIQQLADYAIENVMGDEKDIGSGNKYARFFKSVAKRTATMVAEWQAIGFNHGVMNTDNMSILGLTMDYGPFQMMDYYNPRYICNHSDEAGRYAFHRQPSVCMFNLVKFSMPLFELIGAGEQVDSLVFPKEGRENATDEETLEQYRSTAKEFVQEVLNTEFKGWFMDRLLYKSSQKIGLDVEKKKPTSDDMEAVIVPLLDWLTDYQVDHHRFYRSLSNYKITSAGEEKDAQDAVDQHLVIITQDDAVLADCKAALKPWLSIYRHRLLDDAVDCSKRKERMDTVNPRFILRNSIAQNVIDAFEEDSLHDATLVLNACFEACIDPFKEHYDNPIIENWIAQPVPDEDLRCSCSS